MVSKYCHTCKRETTHRHLKKIGFFSQCFIACVTVFGLVLIEPDLECNGCGLRSNDD